VRDLALSKDRQSVYASSELPVTKSGWCVLRALADKPEYPVLDLYPYATTSPIYITVGGNSVKSANDAKYIEAWIDRLIEAADANTNWNTQGEKESLMNLLQDARAIYSRTSD
jgi:hypothetical protein